MRGDRRQSASWESSCAPALPGIFTIPASGGSAMRYADDHLLGFTGPRAEAEQIKTRLASSSAKTSDWN